MLETILWRALLRKAALWAALVIAVVGFIWWFNLRGEKIKRLQASEKAVQAQLATERLSHQKQIEAYQAGFRAVSELQSKRVEVVTRLQTIESEVAHAPITRDCADSPAVRIALGELREQAAGPAGGADHP
jgi:uncharacterized protein HemX